MFAKFASKTTFHGFMEISETSSTVFKFLWISVVISAFGLTTFQIYRGIDQFINQPVITNVIPANPKDILYPPLKLCSQHWIYWVDWRKAYSMNFTKPALLYALSFAADVDSYATFDTEDAKRQLMLQMSFNNMSRILTLYDILVRAPPLEITYWKNEKIEKIDITHLFITMDNRFLLCYQICMKGMTWRTNGDRSVLIKIVDLTHDYVQRDVSEAEYRYTILKSMSALYKMLKLQTSRSSTENLTRFGLPWVFTVTTEYQNVEVGIDKIWYDFRLLISAKRVQSKSGKNDLKWNRQTMINEDSKCRAKYHLQTCSCLPLGEAFSIEEDALEKVCKKEIIFANDSDNFDAEKRENRCQETPTALLELQNCRRNIPIPCELWEYTFTQSESQINPKLVSMFDKNETWLYVLYPEANEILISSEIDVQTWESFIGSVGGVLGIWTGASVLSFIQAIYFFCASKRKTGNDDGS